MGGNIMKSREEYIDKLAAQLKEWSARIDELQTKANTAKDDVKIGYENHIKHLQEKRDTANHKLQELKAAGTDAWETLMAGAEAAWKDLEKAFTAAKDKFNKPGVSGGRGN
jgi:predicted  nucleic acid-binding Zn-ribbon protein